MAYRFSRPQTSATTMYLLIFRLLFPAVCAVAALLPLVGDSIATLRRPPPEWPSMFENRPLYQIPLSEMEERFNKGFPGHTARFSDGQRQFIIRWITAGTRKLHSSADCFRGLGYTVAPAPALLDRAGAHWSCFTAVRGPHRLHVRERIAESGGKTGQAWTDVSAWFWSALLQKSHGPWIATTVIETAG